MTGVCAAGGVQLGSGYGWASDEATGELGSITYPSGTVLQYSYDAAGRISGLRFGEHDLARDIRYLPFGPVTGMRLGGVNLSRSYDQRYQASRIQAGSLDYVYTRNAAGQVTESKGLAVPAVESGSESYSIDAASNQLTVRAGKNYSYDAAGRLLSDGIRSFGWDALGRLKTVRRNGQELAGYGYDSQNRRVRKTVGTKTTYYLYDLESRLIAEIAGNGRVLREYVWLGQEPLALREYEVRSGLYFYINDHLGTPQRLITGEGTVVWQAAALPFGRTQVQLGTVQNNLRFPGQYFDAETGLHYNWNRYYDPETGRYLSPDPIGLEGGLNLYAYVNNDPVNWSDPWGLTRDSYAEDDDNCWVNCMKNYQGMCTAISLTTLGTLGNMKIPGKEWKGHGSPFTSLSRRFGAKGTLKGGATVLRGSIGRIKYLGLSGTIAAGSVALGGGYIIGASAMCVSECLK